MSLPGVTTFAGDIYIRGTNVKASVVNELLKDVNTVGGIVHCHGGGGSMSGTSVSNEQAYFAPGDDQLVFASLTNVTDINIYFNKVRNSAGQYSGPSAASFPELRHLAGTVRMYWNEKLKTISMPKLVGVGGGIRIYSNNVLTTVDIQSLVSVGDDLSLNSNNILPTLVMQSLVSVGGEFNLRSSPLLTTTGVTVSKEFTFLGYMFVAPDSPFECTPPPASFLFSLLLFSSSSSSPSLLSTVGSSFLHFFPSNPFPTYKHPPTLIPPSSSSPFIYIYIPDSMLAKHEDGGATDRRRREARWG